MKNIHVLPTDKPSRLAYIFDNLFLDSKLLKPALYKVQDIYITSDEEIKEGDWVINLNSSYAHKELCRIDNQFELERYAKKTSNNCKKIILTTDQELIKDGVQAIDDEFLEWFVKNPSCEEVEFLYEPKNFLDIKQGWEYLIISKIIKEEPNKTHYLDEAPNIDKDALLKMWNAAMPKLEPKQETLEEVAERHDYTLGVEYCAFIEGAKWKQEQDKNKFSEEEVLHIIDIFLSEYRDSLTNKTDFYPALMFEQFKKK